MWRRCRGLLAWALVLVSGPGWAGPVQAAGGGDPVLVAAGDVARCNDSGDEATASLLDAIPGTVAMLGDGAYPDGTAQEYSTCYDPSWGRHKAMTKPVTGNHDYVTPKASGYFGYFGAAAGDPAKGYYSYDLGSWHLIALNSTCKAVGGCEAGSSMEQWVKADLAAHPAACILAYWHHPRYFSPAREPNVPHFDSVDRKMSAIWRDLQAAGAAVALAGHRHVYERFARQDADGHADPKGVRQFVVGTGGGDFEKFTTGPAPNSEIRQEGVFGVLELTLHAASYDWRFVPVAGQSFTDSGSESCRH